MPWGEWMTSAPRRGVEPYLASRTHYRRGYEWAASSANYYEEGSLADADRLAALETRWGVAKNGPFTNNDQFTLYDPSTGTVPTGLWDAMTLNWQLWVDWSYSYDTVTKDLLLSWYRIWTAMRHGVNSYDFTGVLDERPPRPQELGDLTYGVDYIEVPSDLHSLPGVVLDESYQPPVVWVQYDPNDQATYPAGGGMVGREVQWMEFTEPQPTPMTMSVVQVDNLTVTQQAPAQTDSLVPGDEVWFSGVSTDASIALQFVNFPVNDKLRGQQISLKYVHEQLGGSMPAVPPPKYVYPPTPTYDAYLGGQVQSVSVWYRPYVTVQLPRWRYWRPGGGWTVGAVGVR